MCLFNVFRGDEAATKVSFIVKVFRNKQVLVTITDSAKFGSTFSANKVSMEAQGLSDPMAMLLYGDSGAGGYDPLDDEDLDGDGSERQPLPKDTIETSLLLGDRKSQEIGELFTTALFRMLEEVPKFTGLEGMVLQVSLGILKAVPSSERANQ